MIATALIGIAAVSFQPGPAAEPQWLVGQWVWAPENEPGPMDNCGTEYSLDYAADGTYRFGGEFGDWQLENERLTEIPRRIAPDHWSPSSPSEIGQPWAARIESLGADRFRKHYVNGTTLVFYRCPAR